jgi:hypothetical protein
MRLVSITDGNWQWQQQAALYVLIGDILEAHSSPPAVICRPTSSFLIKPLCGITTALLPCMATLVRDW